MIPQRPQKENKNLHDRNRELEIGNDILPEEKEYSKNRTVTISACVNSKTYSCTFRKAAQRSTLALVRSLVKITAD